MPPDEGFGALPQGPWPGGRGSFPRGSRATNDREAWRSRGPSTCLRSTTTCWRRSRFSATSAARGARTASKRSRRNCRRVVTAAPALPWVGPGRWRTGDHPHFPPDGFIAAVRRPVHHEQVTKMPPATAKNTRPGGLAIRRSTLMTTQRYRAADCRSTIIVGDYGRIVDVICPMSESAALH